MNRYLVAGAAEFIVSHVCEFLLEDSPDMVLFRFNQWICKRKLLRLNGDGEQS